MVAGAAPELKQAFENRFGVPLLDTYGMTEMEPLTLPTWSDPPGSCGRAGRDFELAVVDASDQHLPPGVEDGGVYHGARSGYFVSDDQRAWQDVYRHRLDAALHPSPAPARAAE